MEEAEMIVLLQKYWAADTTVEEERRLAEYFQQPGLGPEWDSVRAVFEWREEEAEVKVGPGFDERMLRRIAAMEAEGAGADRLGSAGGGSKRVRAMFRFSVAASIVLCLGIGLLIRAVSPGTASGTADTAGTTAVATAGATAGAAAGAAAGNPIKDTYTDPRQALAAVRQALLVASVRMNEGKQITQKNIDRLHDTWQVATGQKRQL